MNSYMLPALEEEELVGPVADALVARTGRTGAAPFSQPLGFELLDGQRVSTTASRPT